MHIIYLSYVPEAILVIKTYKYQYSTYALIPSEILRPY